MAQQITGGLIYPSAGFIAAHNESHRIIVGLVSATPHYDEEEIDTAGLAQLVSSFYGVPSTLADAINVVNKAKALFNDHLSRHNSGSGKKIFAHKVVDTNTVSTADMSAGSTYEASILTSLITLVNELRTDYEAHRASATFHAAADTTYILGGSPTITTYAELATELNNLKAQYNAHIAFSVGASPHPTADSSNGVTAANASGTDIDSCITLANQIKSKYNAHRTQASVHSSNDTTNVVSGADVAYPADLFTLANAIKAAYNTHRSSTTYHESSDGTYVISSSDATTVATLIALAAEIRTDLDGHLSNGPGTWALRGV